MGGKYLSRREVLLGFASRMSCNLGSPRPGEAGLFQVLPDLCGTGAGRLQILGRVALNFRCAAFPCLYLVAKVLEPLE